MADAKSGLTRLYDIVLYGASGTNGLSILEGFFSKGFGEKHKLAVAGRNRQKLETTLLEVGCQIGQDLSAVPIIIAHSEDEHSLSEMAKQTQLIINVVGPYRLHGEAVIKAAVENGTSHIDISCEPSWLEKMQLLYNKRAKETGAYIIGACGWNSLLCDVGVSFTYSLLMPQQRGYGYSDTNYKSLIMSMANASSDRIGEIRCNLMPEKLDEFGHGLPERPRIWYNSKLKSYCYPVGGVDKSVVVRSQYFDSVNKEEHAVKVETYWASTTWIWAWIVCLWLSFLNKVLQYPRCFSYMLAHRSVGSLNTFDNSAKRRRAHTRPSVVLAYKFYGYGWPSRKPNLDRKPILLASARCDGPLEAYIGISSCVLAATSTFFEYRSRLPKEGGVYTTAIVFARTKILDYLESHNIKFELSLEKPPPNELDGSESDDSW